ncbi:MAG: PLP-dependent transferase [Dehalococcoidia bacterium]|nr:PLP-dependent transferase [Dehalococcoidia bacterium]
MRFETEAVHGASGPDPLTGAVVPPVYQTSTFVFEDVGKTRGYDYSRTSNPTRKELELTIAALEGAGHGFAFATGMAAESTVMHLLKQGDHVIAQEDLYGGTYRLFESVMNRFGLEFTFLDINDRRSIEKAIRPNTRMVWFETVSNPLLNVVDIQMIADVAGGHGLLTVADNTLPTPYLVRPVEYGIDLVVHSTTKYLNGHCDVVGGAVVTASPELAERMQFLSNALGTCASPFDCWLVLRGIRTLPIRMRQHEENARAIAAFLNAHPAVKEVFYPGLPSHPSHQLAARLLKGFGGMVSFEIHGGIPSVNSFLRTVKYFALAESLGGVHSLAEHPATMSHASMPEEFRKNAGINDDLIRLSIGIENVDDLIEDLSRSLAAGQRQ